MAMEFSPSHSQAPHPLKMASPPPLQPQPPHVSSTAAGRRIPPPCWSHEETAALIDSYREKWHSLNRNNLRAAHWQEVADGVAARCPHSSPAKTSIQCRHKMEKLRKRYRSELRRSLSLPNPNRRFSSSWILFNKMHDMEKPEDDDDVDVDVDLNNDDDDDCCGGYLVRDSVTNGGGGLAIPAPSSSNLGFRSKNIGKFDDKGNPNLNYKASGVINDGGVGGTTPELGKKGDELKFMVDAVKMLGEGFVKVEKMKMDMAREIEQMRMEMEMKRARMILESQRQLVEVFVKGIPKYLGKKPNTPT